MANRLDQATGQAEERFPHEEAIKGGEDFFGKSVILGAGLHQAEGQEIQVSSLLKALVESSDGF